MFEIVDKEACPTVIKVVGVGGAGGNAVDHMIREGVQGVEFICVNTDAQALHRNLAGVKVQLGPGLGAGGKPEVGREWANAERDRVAEAIEGAHMVFITAGMGGGTGTGAAPIVAQVAREKGILTVAVVTKPFEFEMGKKLKLAEEGLTELGQNVDSLIVVLNEKLMEVLGDDVSMVDAFKGADNVLRNAVGGIAEIINVPGLMNVDFEDVRTVMGEMGKAMMGFGESTGVDRARIAADAAVASPLLEGIELSGARGVLVNITASQQIGMKEIREVMKAIENYTNENATVKFGTVIDEGMEDRLRVTVVATGLGTPPKRRASKPEPVLVFDTVRRTGTDNQPVFTDAQAQSTTQAAPPSLDDLFSSPRGGRTQTASEMENRGMAKDDIPAWLRRDGQSPEVPAFLRKQAD
jgi:cell division protein FtsZ